MLRIISLLVTLLVFSGGTLAQSRVAEFGGLDAWYLAQGQWIPTPCNVSWVEDSTGKQFCFASEDERDAFVQDADASMARASASAAASSDTIAPAAGPVVTALSANTIYMVNFGNPSSLYTLRPGTGASTRVGAMGVSQVTDIAFSGSTLYGVSFTQFLTINPNTGKATVKGSLGFSDINALVVQPSTGKIFGAGSSAPGSFVSINPNTGKATRIGSFGAGLSSAGDLEFINGVLYATLDRNGFNNSFLARINLSNGAATLIGDMRFKDVWGLALRGGVLYGATNSGQLIRVNTANGVGTLIGSNGIAQAGLAKSP